MSERYEFAPLEKTGLFSGISPRQTIAAAITLALAFSALQMLGSSAGLLAALLILVAGFAAITRPVFGRPAVEWTDIALRFLLRSKTGKAHYRAAGPQIGHVEVLGEEVVAPVDLPDELSSIEILGVPHKGHELGVVFDQDQRTYSATLSVTATAFALLDPDAQAQKLAAWSAVISDLAREDSPVSRMQWVERTLPANQEELVDYLREEHDPEIDIQDPPPVMRSYLSLLDQAANVQQQHELLLTLRIDTTNRRVRRMAKNLGSGHDGYCALLLRELEAFSRSLERADVKVIGALRPRALAGVLRSAYDPYDESIDPAGDVDPATIGPMEGHARWDAYATDGALHVTYWISEWPRVSVGPTFFSPLLLGTSATRAIGVTVEPVAPLRAMRRAEAAATSELADEELRASKGFRTVARTRRRQQAITAREEELANGYAEVRFAGFITVTAKSSRELDAACAEVEHAAQQSRLSLRRLSGQQDEAMTFAMPLARGLKGEMFT